MGAVEAEDSSRSDRLACHTGHRVPEVELEDRCSEDTQDQAAEDSETCNLVVQEEDTYPCRKVGVHVYSHHSHEYEEAGAESPCSP